MTAQASDRLEFDGYSRSLIGEPLHAWLARPKNKGLRFMRRTTACSRGYVATWQVFNGRLFLKSIDGTFRGGSPARIESLFLNYSSQYLDSVKAHHPDNAGPGQFAFWVTGQLGCAIGKLLYYVHYGYMSVYERTLLLSITNGFVTGQQIIDNEPPPSRMINGEWLSDFELELELGFDAETDDPTC